MPLHELTDTINYSNVKDEKLFLIKIIACERTCNRFGQLTAMIESSIIGEIAQ